MPDGFTQTFGGLTVNPTSVSFAGYTISENLVLEWPLEADAGTDVVAAQNNVSATAPNLTVAMPDATLATQGAGALFTNTGANTFTVTDTNGNTLAAIPSGTSWYLYLIDNTTTGGAWQVLQFGAGTSTANAASLAGAGLQAVLTRLNQNLVTTPLNGDYSPSRNDLATVLRNTGGTVAYTPISAVTLGRGWFVYVINNGGGSLTWTPVSGQTIDGDATKVFNPTESAIIFSDGANFWTLGYGRSVTSTVTSAAINVAGGPTTVNLNSNQLAAQVQNYAGALTGDITVNYGTGPGFWFVQNNTSGPYNLILRVNGSDAGATIPQGTFAAIRSDGSNVAVALTTTSGTVSNVATAAGQLVGGPITSTGTIGLATTAVTPAVYGDAANVPQISVDAFGRVTSATEVSISISIAQLAQFTSGQFASRLFSGALTAGTYYYVVTALTAAGETVASNTQSQVTSGAASNITVSWSAIAGATGYRVYRGLTPISLDTFFAASASATSFTDVGASGTSDSPPASNTAVLPPPTQNAVAPSTSGGTLSAGTYYYVVTALTGAGETTISNETTIATVAPPVQSATSTSATGGTLPANTYYYVVTAVTAAGETSASNEEVQVTTGSTSTVHLTWAPVLGATGYNVYRGTAAGAENVQYSAGTSTTFTDTGATGATASPPAANLNSNTISWGAVAGATGYRVYRGTVSGGENVQYAGGTGTSFVDTGSTGTTASPPTSNTAAILVPVQGAPVVSAQGGTGTGSVVFSNSPALTGTPTAPTQAAGDSSTAVATTAFVSAAATPTGTVTAFAGSSAPTGFLICDGSAISRATFAALFAVIGTTYGSGNGITTFNIPDLRGRVIAAPDGGAGRLGSGTTGGFTGAATLAATGGEQSHTLTIPEMPAHTHSENGTLSFNATPIPAGQSGNTGNLFANVATGSAGGDGGHNNVQPTLILNYIIKT